MSHTTTHKGVSSTKLKPARNVSTKTVHNFIFRHNVIPERWWFAGKLEPLSLHSTLPMQLVNSSNILSSTKIHTTASHYSNARSQLSILT